MSPEYIATIVGIVAAIGAAYLSFLVRRADRRIAKFEELFVQQAELREKVRVNTATLAELRSETNESRNVLSTVREQLAYIRASIDSRVD